MNNVKMILVIRKDLKMRRGKECSQASHSAVGAITNQLNLKETPQGFKLSGYVDKPTYEWLQGSFRKITVTVNSEEELLELKQKCDKANIRTTLIEDNGLTEFHGIKTKTVLAVGPDYDEVLDPITKELTLY